jgi:sialate O-acetylesterase
MDSIVPQDEAQSFDGAVWFRRTFDLPEAWEGKALKLELGPIRDYDDTYVNGTKVGYTKEAPADPSLDDRTYRISPGIPVHGVNSIAIRVFSAQGVCGLTGFPDQMRITLFDGSSTDSIPLAGPWMEKIERKMDSTDPAPHMPLGPGSPSAPGGLFNGMIAPLAPFGIKGVIWYQGESNAGEADRYRILFPTLIHDWRQKWGRQDLPFYFVQLPNYKARQEEPSDSEWAELREAQASALRILHTGMATTIDIGDATTIHPTNKREVGRRLSLIALAKDYGMHTAYSGPEFQYLTPSGNTVRVFFKHIEDGLKTSDGRPPIGFAVAGEDRKFYWAEAKIQGTAVVLSSSNVPNPVAVRYGWADNPDCNLTNSTGLPTAPFRTDTWPRSEPK